MRWSLPSVQSIVRSPVCLFAVTIVTLALGIFVYSKFCGDVIAAKIIVIITENNIPVTIRLNPTASSKFVPCPSNHKIPPMFAVVKSEAYIEIIILYSVFMFYLTKLNIVLCRI